MIPNNTSAPAEAIGSLASDAISAGDDVSGKVIDSVTSHAVDLANDVAVPAAKFAALRFVKNRGKVLVIGAILLVVVPMAVKKWRSRADNGSSSTSSTTTTRDNDVTADIPTIESRV